MDLLVTVPLPQHMDHILTDDYDFAMDLDCSTSLELILRRMIFVEM